MTHQGGSQRPDVPWALSAQTTLVVNPSSELLINLYGADAGAHARTAIGMAALPVNLPVILAAEVELGA